MGLYMLSSPGGPSIVVPLVGTLIDLRLLPQYVNASPVIYKPDHLAFSWGPPKKSNKQFV